ncbi:hypothetical protein [Sphingobacterium athyrii]|nr:hypothetical protein [Sphingobacterium athyrii]
MHDIGSVYVSQQNGGYNTFLKKDIQLDSVIIAYKERLPVSLRFYYLDGIKRPVEDFYFLDFPGDRYLLNLDFGRFDIPDYPTATLMLPSSNKELVKKRKADTRAIFYRDSIKYETIITEVESDPSFREPMAVTFSANYLRGGKKLQQDFTNFMQILEKSEIPKDGSVFLFQGLVKEDGSLNNIKTIIGDNSIYENLLKKWSVGLGKSWKAATQGGRRVKSNMDIFVEVRGGRAEISTCGYARGSKSYKKINLNDSSFKQQKVDFEK